MTYHPKSDFLRVMIERGFLADCTDYQGLDEALAKGLVPAYIGFDATAKSLHVGSLIQIMMLRWLQKTGHKPIVLMGGGTTKVGDPSFRSEERPLMTPDQIETNIAGIKQVFTSYVSFGTGPGDAIMVNNDEWLADLNYLDFLRDIGRHFSINRMLSFESVKSRLDREQSLSFLEFNYMILQAYDFFELNRRYGCLLQMGGSDQWGNIVNGIDLTRRVLDHEIYGLTSPLLTTSGRQEDGQVAVGRGLAECRHAVALRVLAVLAQHDRCRHRAVPEALHRTAGRGLRPSRRARRLRDQRGQDPAGERSHNAACTAPRPRKPPRPPRARSSRRAALATTCRRCRLTASEKSATAFRSCS